MKTVRVRAECGLTTRYLTVDSMDGIECESGIKYIIIIIMTRRQLRSVATTLHDDRDPVPSSTPV